MCQRIYKILHSVKKKNGREHERRWWWPTCSGICKLMHTHALGHSHTHNDDWPETDAQIFPFYIIYLIFFNIKVRLCECPYLIHIDLKFKTQFPNYEMFIFHFLKMFMIRILTRILGIFLDFLLNINRKYPLFSYTETCSIEIISAWCNILSLVKTWRICKVEIQLIEEKRSEKSNFVLD